MVRLASISAALVSLAVAALAHADDTVGSVTGVVTVERAGKPAAAPSVVVYIVGFDEPPPAHIAEIRQEKRRFLPELLPITAGQSVSFPNDDPFFHNVFSPSDSRKFDLGQYPQGETKVKRFGGVGVVEVFCNIHPEMSATILVLPNRRFARASVDGTFRIDGVPAGAWTLYAYSRRALAPVSQSITVEPGRSANARLSLVEARSEFPHLNKFGEKYRDPKTYR